MKLWVLQAIKEVDWDEFDGFVVRAEDEAQAREIAEQTAKYEKQKGFWLSAKTTTCKEVKVHGKAEVILSAFKNS